MPSAIPLPLQPPQPTTILQPLLSALPTGQLPHPPPPVLPHLSPILRQRVKLLAAPTQPWLPLLTYASDDTGDKLIELAHGDKFEPHPVSGEIEVDVDWEDERDVAVRYRRVDAETMWARIEIVGLGLWVRCVYCVGDSEGPVDGWRIGEVGVLKNSGEGEREWFGGLEAAEQAFTAGKVDREAVVGIPTVAEPVQDNGDEDDDAAYWAQYDATPAATPGPDNRSPAPASVRRVPGNGSTQVDGSAEDAYFAQYAGVQPALDAHDPDEAGANGEVESSLGAQHEREFASLAVLGNGNGNGIGEVERAGRERDALIEQPRPRSAASSASGRSAAVEVLEDKVEREGRHDTAVRQHIGASVKSLYRLARAAGMGRGEFRALVETELAVVGVEEDEDEYGGE
ncbi:hypothetical protein VC83_08664 [Pseudogymnoascus destructans]|uniref:Uncharacterized protein n=1 Tax=Pseudogymnoascus destructans TaxID=655981 RepID=A0A177A1D8_9PEZI|nr:uncharacterized protein VC83_08664 [Pseudogymnoascus destructans]OAF54903.1 hypothetical protein VC83_08664 [Pseudogymnoascus destructans]